MGEETLEKMEGRRYLAPDADHCQDCFDLAGLGWTAIDEVVPIGETECGDNCECTIETRKAPGG